MRKLKPYKNKLLPRAVCAYGPATTTPTPPEIGKTYTLPVYWEMSGEIEVKAESLKEAIQKAADTAIPLPQGRYVQDSFGIDTDIAAEQYPKG